MFKKIFLVALVVLCPTSVFGYNNQTTHPALTSQIIKLYELTGKQLTSEQKQALVGGSILADTTPRYINHFYDPVNNTAWTGSKTGNISPETARLISKLGLSSEEPMKAADWIVDYNAQLSYGPYEGDRTWNRALNYYANGKTTEAYKTLGFILHALEDMSVPEHTRDDTHAQGLEAVTTDSGSPYEDFTNQYNTENIDSLNLLADIKASGLLIPLKTTPEDYLKSLAIYSNKYFFSKDTINDPKYNEPKIIEERNGFGYGRDENGNSFALTYISSKNNGDFSTEKRYFIENRKELDGLLSSQFKLLAKKTILHGVGLMQLFDKQAEDALVNKDFPQHLMALDRDKLDTVLNPPTFSLTGLVSKFYGGASTALGGVVNTGRAIQQGAYSAGLAVGNFFVGLFGTSSPATDDILTNNLLPEESAENNDAPGNNQLGEPRYVGTGASSTALRNALLENEYSLLDPLATTTATSTGTATTTTLTENLQPMPAPPLPTKPIVYGGGGSVSATPPTSTSTATTTVAKHIIISEILFNASSSDEGKEFIELYNPLSTSQDLGGWSLRYSKDNATTTTSLASFKASSTEDRVIIPAKGFLLIGLYNYDPLNFAGVSADISRSASLPNGGTSATTQKITVNLYDADKNIVDSTFYDKDSIASEGQSLEREVELADGTCLSAINEYEFMGHGCDIAGRSNFVVREIPKPQNSLNFPEPRNKPETPKIVEGKTSIAEVNKPGLKISYLWTESKDFSGSTSTVKYVLASGTSTVAEVYTTGTEVGIFETGKTYSYKLFAEDADGLNSGEVDASAFFPDLPDNVYFYKDSRSGGGATSTKYLVDLRYSSRPFIRSGDITWQAVVGYFDREPNGANGTLNTANDFKVTDGDGVLFTYVFAVDPTRCDGVGGGLDNSASCLPEEDGRLTFNPEILSTTTARSSYVRLAYYELTHAGGGSQDLSHIASGPKIYLLDGLPAQQNPTIPSNFTVNFDDLNSALSLSWEKSTDADSPDSEITYEVQVSTSTEFSSSSWTNVGKILTTSTLVENQNSYLLGVRAVDDFSNYSEATSKTFTFPIGYEKPFLSARIDSGASQPFAVPVDGVLGEISVYTADFATASRDPSSNPCTLTLYEQIAGVNTQIAVPDNSFNGGSCTGEKTFTFSASSTTLYASSTYSWSFNYSGVPTDPPKLRFYGRSTVLPAGPFSGGSLGSAKFKVKDNMGGVLVEN